MCVYVYVCVCVWCLCSTSFYSARPFCLTWPLLQLRLSMRRNQETISNFPMSSLRWQLGSKPLLLPSFWLWRLSSDLVHRVSHLTLSHDVGNNGRWNPREGNNDDLGTCQAKEIPWSPWQFIEFILPCSPIVLILVPDFSTFKFPSVPSWKAREDDAVSFPLWGYQHCVNFQMGHVTVVQARIFRYWIVQHIDKMARGSLLACPCATCGNSDVMECLWQSKNRIRSAYQQTHAARRSEELKLSAIVACQATFLSLLFISFNSVLP